MGEASRTSGLGLGAVLFLVFLVLKLTGFIDWSWWWVTAPLWVSAGLFLIIMALAVLVMLAVAVAENGWHILKPTRRRRG